MTIKTSGQLLGLLAVLGSSAGMAASVTLTPSDANPDVDEIFFVTISGQDFVQDLGDPFADQTTIGATLGILYSSNLTLVGGVNCPSSPNCTTGQDVNGAGLPASGPFANSSGGSYTPHFNPVDGTPTTPPDPGSLLDFFDITTAVGGVDDFDALILAFQGTSAGAGIIRLVDNQSTYAWFQYSDPFDVIPIDSYTAATVCVGGGVCPVAPEILVTDSVAPPEDLDVAFGAVAVGATGTQTVTVRNDGTDDLVITQIVPPAAPFSIDTDGCSNTTLPALGTCAVVIEFAPLAAGSPSATITIPSDDTDEPNVIVTLTGTGVGGPVPNIVVTDSTNPPDDLTVIFGSVTVGGAPSTQTVTITNDGNAVLNIGSLAGLASPFSISIDECSNQALNQLNSCNITLAFQPIADGPVSGVLNIPSDDPDSATTDVAVNGTGVVPAVPNIRVTDTTDPVDDEIVDFGLITVGGTSTQTVTVHNDGNAALAVGAITGLGAPYALMNDTCSSTSVPAAGSCTFDIDFSPVAAGTVNEVISIPSDDPDTATVAVTVNGEGTFGMVGDITVTDSINPAADLRLPFGYIEENTTKHHTVTILNDGSDNLVLGQVGGVIPLETPFTFDPDGCSNQTLAPSETCTITIAFAPPGTDVFYNDSFDIPTDDPDEDSVIVAVSGGAQPGIRSDSPGDSALDPLTLLGLSLVGLAVKRRRRAA